MNKGELVDAIADRADVTKKSVEQILAVAIDVIGETVASGDKVTLIDFGVFEARDRKSRQGRNPSTGEVVQIPASRVPRFSPGKGFKKKVSA